VPVPVVPVYCRSRPAGETGPPVQLVIGEPLTSAATPEDVRKALQSLET
jgi:hypothetical protein